MSFLVEKNTINCASVSSGQYACCDYQKDLQMLRGPQIEGKFKNRGLIHDVPRYYGQFF